MQRASQRYDTDYGGLNLNLKVNEEMMHQELGQFGVAYNAPCYISINDLSGFMSSSMTIRCGYAAYTDNGELLLFIDCLMGNKLEVLTADGVQSLSCKKLPLLPQHSIKISGIANGKKYKYKMLIPHKVVGKFASQPENSAELISFLESWR